jgi:hypothetical protein
VNDRRLNLPEETFIGLCESASIPLRSEAGKVSALLVVEAPAARMRMARSLNCGVYRHKNSKFPQGRLMATLQPSLRDSTFCQLVPALKCQAIFDGSFGTKCPRYGIALDKWMGEK